MTTRQPHGRVETTPDGRRLLLIRSLPHPPATVWRHLTDADLLGRWYGTFTGDPASGEVELTMVEAPDHPGPVTIRRCDDRHHLLSVAVAGPGGAAWQLAVSLSPGPEDSTRIEFDHDHTGMTEPTGDLGPGWEYYLERLAVALDGGDPDTVDWAEFHPALTGHYSG